MVIRPLLSISAKLAAAIAVPAMLGARVALSHHAPYGQFAIDDPIDFTGEVVAVEWVNPHAFVLVRTKLDGAEVVYRIELQGLRQLRDKGWQGDELAVGQTVRVVNAAVGLDEGSRRICCARIYDLNGREFYTDPRRAPPASPPGRATDLP
jgi:Family of unknown function (DUF6152)